MGSGGMSRSRGGRGKEAILQPAGADKQHESKNHDLEELETMMAKNLQKNVPINTLSFYTSIGPLPSSSIPLVIPPLF